MTKLVPLIMLCLLLTAAVIQGQTPGNFTIHAGVGLVPTYYGKQAETNLPALSIQAGYQVSKRFSLHGFFARTQLTSQPRALSDGFITQMKNKTTVFGLRGQVNKDLTPKASIYGGALLGYAAFNISEFYTGTGQPVHRDPDAPTPYDPNGPKGDLVYSGFIGVHFALNRTIGLYSEVGYGISLLNSGVSLRF